MFEVREGGLCEEHVADNIGAERVKYLLLLQRFELCTNISATVGGVGAAKYVIVVLLYGSIVDENVETAKIFHRSFHPLHARVLIAHVALQHQAVLPFRLH